MIVMYLTCCINRHRHPDATGLVLSDFKCITLPIYLKNKTAFKMLKKSFNLKFTKRDTIHKKIK